MKKIKVFASDVWYELEYKVNKFMSEHEVVDIQFSSDNMNLYTVLIVYVE